MCRAHSLQFTMQLFHQHISLASSIVAAEKKKKKSIDMSNLNFKIKPGSLHSLPADSTTPLMAATPANPQLQGDHRQVLLHFSHPQHPLLRINLPYLFTCMGCKEYGAGSRFRCLTCGFDLHDFCALAPLALMNHPFHHKHQVAFFAKPGGGFLRSRCDVCGKAEKGYAFRCTACSFEMHPCCAAMRAEMSFPIHQHPLILSRPPSAASVDSISGSCVLCRRKRSGRVYRCSMACGYCLHAVCAKDMVNGLYIHGFRSPEKSSNYKLGVAARVATQALFGIIGGLIEGIGEGLGEALIENIGRGTVRSIK